MKVLNIQDLRTRLLEDSVKAQVITGSLVRRPGCSRGVAVSASSHSTISTNWYRPKDRNVRAAALHGRRNLMAVT